MIVAHNALFLSSAARTEPQNALGPHHGDQHAAEQGKKRDKFRTHLSSPLSTIMLSTSMITPPEMQNTVFLFKVMRYPR